MEWTEWRITTRQNSRSLGLFFPINFLTSCRFCRFVSLDLPCQTGRIPLPPPRSTRPPRFRPLWLTPLPHPESSPGLRPNPTMAA